MSAPRNPDAALLTLYRQFLEAHKVGQRLRRKHMQLRAEAEADPACPKPSSPTSDRASYEAWNAFMDAKGCGCESFDEWNKAARRAGGIANKIMQTRARTLPGVLAKARVVHIAVGRRLWDDLSGARDLLNYEPKRGGWVPSLVRDLERLAKYRT